MSRRERRAMCSVTDCPNRVNAHGLCTTHERRSKLGIPLTADIFWIKFDRNIQKATGCWEWTGHLNDGGYGVFGQEKKYAHRLSWARQNGPIPNGAQLDHLCRNRACVNPDHLEPVTPRTNILRGMSPNAIAFRTNRCKRGHEFTPENTYRRPDNGNRQCRACAQLRSQKRWAA